MRKESRQDSMPRCAQGARIWQVPKTLLRMRTKPGSTVDSSSSQLLFLDHSPTTTTLQGSTNPRVTPFVTAWVQHPHFGSNILILVPSSLNLFSRAVTPSHATARADFTCFHFCPQQQHLLLLPIHACQALHYYTGKC